MGDAFIGSEALRAGRLSPYTLRSRFVAIHPDVYIARESEISAITRAKAAFLWTGRRGVVAGRSAAALHRAKWVSADRPAQLLWGNRRAPSGIQVWSHNAADDEIAVVDGIRVTNPARTALDIACRNPIGKAVAAIDALARATHLKIADVEQLAARHKGRRGIRNALEVLDLVDAGAESPRETWLRLLVIRHGFPRPRTQIQIVDEYGVRVAVPDMGWEDVRLALDYDGEHHRNPQQFNKDIRRHDALTELGWTDIRVTSLDTEAVIIARLAKEWARRT
jgi:very-short-patch-repair endonuclease